MSKIEPNEDGSHPNSLPKAVPPIPSMRPAVRLPMPTRPPPLNVAFHRSQPIRLPTAAEIAERNAKRQQEAAEAEAALAAKRARNRLYAARAYARRTGKPLPPLKAAAG